MNKTKILYLEGTAYDNGKIVEDCLTNLLYKLYSNRGEIYE